MKYSILMPYINRHQQLDNTLFSFNHWYVKRDDWEIIIIEDQKNFDNKQHRNNLKIVCDKWAHLPIRKLTFETGPSNPSPLFNAGANIATGKFLILTNPECFHTSDILAAFDHADLSQYIICACESRKNVQYNISSIDDIAGNHHMWYQHTQFRNLCYHFCSMLSKENYIHIGGFKEKYAQGYGYEDNDFRDSIIKSGIKAIARDDLVVIHQWHDQVRPANWKELLKKNQQIYLKS